MKRADQALYEAKRQGRAAGWLLAEPLTDATDPALSGTGTRPTVMDPPGPGRRTSDSVPGTPLSAATETLADIILPQGFPPRVAAAGRRSFLRRQLIASATLQLAHNHSNGHSNALRPA